MATALQPVTRPALRYHGGKWLLAPWLVSQFPPHRTFVESFCGAASVLLRKARSYAEVINDLDSDVATYFRVLRDPRQSLELERLLRLTPFAREEFEAAYEPTNGDPVEQARRLVVRSFMGFGSAAHNVHHVTGFRANSNKSGSTPAQGWARYPDRLPVITARLQGVIIEHRDAVDVIRQHDGPNTLHYVDPPYVQDTRGFRLRNHAYDHELSDAGHAALSEVLHNVSGMVALSGYPCALYADLYRDWPAPLRHSHFADGARERTECLWLNPAAVERARGLF